jgi:sulfoxide reductase heme-binding subunit YedZ
MKNKYIIWLKVAVWAASLGPLVQIAYLGATHDLTANPIEFVTLTTGTSALVFLLITLAVTPLRKLTGLNWLIRFRRLFGLFAFFYALLHLCIFVGVDKFFDWQEILKDVMKRPFITVGFLSFLLMVPLAITSTAWSIRKLGGKKWNLLHRLTYLSAILAIIHFWWKVKADHSEPATYGAILAVLLVYRAAVWVRSRMRTAASEARKPALVAE